MSKLSPAGKPLANPSPEFGKCGKSVLVSCTSLCFFAALGAGITVLPGRARYRAGSLPAAGNAVQEIHAGAHSVFEPVGEETLAQIGEHAGLAQCLAYFAIAHHKDDRHGTRVAAFDEEGQGMGAGGVDEKDAVDMQDNEGGGRAFFPA